MVITLFLRNAEVSVPYSLHSEFKILLSPPVTAIATIRVGFYNRQSDDFFKFKNSNIKIRRTIIFHKSNLLIKTEMLMNNTGHIDPQNKLN